LIAFDFLSDISPYISCFAAADISFQRRALRYFADIAIADSYYFAAMLI